MWRGSATTTIPCGDHSRRRRVRHVVVRRRRRCDVGLRIAGVRSAYTAVSIANRPFDLRRPCCVYPRRGRRRPSARPRERQRTVRRFSTRIAENKPGLRIIKKMCDIVQDLFCDDVSPRRAFARGFARLVHRATRATRHIRRHGAPAPSACAPLRALSANLRRAPPCEARRPRTVARARSLARTPPYDYTPAPRAGRRPLAAPILAADGQQAPQLDPLLLVCSVTSMVSGR